MYQTFSISSLEPNTMFCWPGFCFFQTHCTYQFRKAKRLFKLKLPHRYEILFLCQPDLKFRRKKWNISTVVNLVHGFQIILKSHLAENVKTPIMLQTLLSQRCTFQNWAFLIWEDQTHYIIFYSDNKNHQSSRPNLLVF